MIAKAQCQRVVVLIPVLKAIVSSVKCTVCDTDLTTRVFAFALVFFFLFSFYYFCFWTFRYDTAWPDRVIYFIFTSGDTPGGEVVLFLDTEPSTSHRDNLM